MDEIKTNSERDDVGPTRILFLSVCTTVLAIVFLALLIGDNVSATSF